MVHLVDWLSLVATWPWLSVSYEHYGSQRARDVRMSTHRDIHRQAVLYSLDKFPHDLEWFHGLQFQYDGGSFRHAMTGQIVHQDESCKRHLSGQIAQFRLHRFH